MDANLHILNKKHIRSILFLHPDTDKPAKSLGYPIPMLFQTMYFSE